MSAPSQLRQRDCPICGAKAASGTLFLERRLDAERLTAFSFAARKVPEYMCYTLLRCPKCDAIYACESPHASELGAAYHQAAYDSKIEAVHAAQAYERALTPYFSSLAERGAALEIGTGTGVFLQRLRSKGFSEVIGVEPSRAAIDAADADIRPCIREGLFSAADFEPASLSMIACFMTLEHVIDPAGLVQDCFRLLKPGGLMAAVVHDWRAWNNRWLGRRSPIIDIEHLQLFSKPSAIHLFRRCGFAEIECRSFWNSYRLDYWNRLMPIPLVLKRGLGVALRATGIGRLRLAMNVGNLMVVAHKRNA